MTSQSTENYTCNLNYVILNKSHYYLLKNENSPVLCTKNYVFWTSRITTRLKNENSFRIKKEKTDQG